MLPRPRWVTVGKGTEVAARLVNRCDTSGGIPGQIQMATSCCGDHKILMFWRKKKKKLDVFYLVKNVSFAEIYIEIKKKSRAQDTLRQQWMTRTFTCQSLYREGCGAPTSSLPNESFKEFPLYQSFMSQSYDLFRSFCFDILRRWS